MWDLCTLDFPAFWRPTLFPHGVITLESLRFQIISGLDPYPQSNLPLVNIRAINL